MEALDGNAIAGQLYVHYRVEMTTAAGTCAHCGTRARIAELRVYNRGPGAVGRCPSCERVVMVVVDLRGHTRVHMDGFRLAEPPESFTTR
ncbi:MAG TPA: DUF6510 family protein [Solirubrobacteraceae bacterium]|jgi:hypothetical protein|nr:DUF6510 family protein [Solirubrobacteraceae bacterium]